MVSDLTVAIRQNPDDESAWDAWFREVYPRVVYIVARKAVGDIDLAEEVTQGAIERFLRYRAFERVRSDREAVAYLVQSAARLVADNRRYRELTLSYQLEDSAEHSEEETDSDLEFLLSHISEQDQEVLRLVLEGYTVREIADAFGIGYSAAGMRINRARDRLRKVVQGV